MGLARIKTLLDLRRIDVHLRIRCPECRHEVVYERETMIGYFLSKRWNMAWELVGSRFRCEACRHRGAEVTPVPLGYGSPSRAKPARPMPMTEREHRAEIRRRRG